jgi:hypothetical protein
MPLNDAEWRDAEVRESLIDLVYDVFEQRGPQAYSAEEIFDEFDDLGLRGNAAEEVADEFEFALEVLVHEGRMEKRIAVDDDGDPRTYYRAI